MKRRTPPESTQINLLSLLGSCRQAIDHQLQSGITGLADDVSYLKEMEIDWWHRNIS
jgi:hypothetical protein